MIWFYSSFIKMIKNEAISGRMATSNAFNRSPPLSIEHLIWPLHDCLQIADWRRGEAKWIAFSSSFDQMPIDHHCCVGENVSVCEQTRSFVCTCLSLFVAVVVVVTLKIETCVFSLTFPISKTRPGSSLSLWSVWSSLSLVVDKTTKIVHFLLRIREEKRRMSECKYR